MSAKEDRGPSKSVPWPVWAGVMLTVALIGAYATIVSNRPQPEPDPNPGDPGLPEAAPPRSPLGSAIQALATDDREPAGFEARRAAILELTSLAAGANDVATKRTGIRALRDYVKENAARRKTVGPGVKEGRGTYRAQDILAALEGLQLIRQSGPGDLEVNLAGVDFSRLDLSSLPHDGCSGFKFDYADFTGAFLSGTDWSQATMRHANLTNAAIWNADMQRVDFARANLQGAKFVSVNLAGSTIEQATHRQVARFDSIQGLNAGQRAAFGR